ncbi:MAG TPA: CehA/McbA family metallohydrolase [Steroidobacteraceae bacterium]|nr:CehA/McbA family metallohydrolase [Steroidobacteraceae bacterium]
MLIGPTPIPNGAARRPGDITVSNEHLAFALAVRSPAPYGVPRGALVDLAPVRDGKIGRDCVVFADFIPNNWSAWPNTYQRVEVLERGPGRAVLRAVRDFGQVTITTLYTLTAGADQIALHATMSNGGSVALAGLLSGFTLWPKGGFLFPVPGLAGVTAGKADRALADRVSGYDAGWTVTLHAPYLDQVGSDSRDLFRLHTLEPGESRSFDAWLQVGASGDLAPVLREEIGRRHLAAGTVHGIVAAAGRGAIPRPVVMVEKRGAPYAWTLGHAGRYELTLPAGDYTLYATARGYSRSAPAALTVGAGTGQTHDFPDLRSPGRIEFSVSDARTGRPLDARLVITQGDKPPLGFLGRTTFFTELEPRGRLGVPIAPGRYVFSVSSGGGFLAPAAALSVEVAPRAVVRRKIALTRLFDPPARGWYAADLHHHADQAEAVTPPEYVARSQLAAGLDLLFVSDHDSTVNDAALQRIAARRGVAFIPSIELSSSWGHFNAWPLNPGATLAIDTSTAGIAAILHEGRRLGARVIQVNHPFIPFGYFASLAGHVAPGGFDPRFELIEINASVPDDDPKVLHTLWDYWNGAHRYYLSGGTDTHDVWNEESGRVRTFAHLDGPPSARAFAAALASGHGYVSHGPLIFPSVEFGDELKLRPGEAFTLGFALASVAGLASAELIGNGARLETRSFAGAPHEARADFELSTRNPAWYALVVEDKAGRKAYTDPIRVDTVESPPAAAPPAAPR